MERRLRQAAREAPFDEEEARRAYAAVRLVVPTLLFHSTAEASASKGGPAPRQLGEYRLLHPVGEPSGQGVVWRAVETNTGRECAVKVMRADSNGPDYVARFRREIVALVDRIKDPNVVLAYDACIEKDELYLVMELLDGLSLSDVLKRHGRLPVADACEIVCQAATGLHSAHRAGLAHRDVKPANLFLTREGKVKLLDLGLARMFEDAGEELTGAGALMGTPGFMSPEQIDDPRKADARANLYSLGCVLYLLLTGQPPHGVVVSPALRRDDGALVAAYRAAPIVPVRSLCPDVPEELANALGRLLAPRPEDRPRSAAELIAALAPLRPPRHDLRYLLPPTGPEDRNAKPMAPGAPLALPTLPPTGLTGRDTKAAAASIRTSPLSELPTSRPPRRPRARWEVVSLSVAAAIGLLALAWALGLLSPDKGDRGNGPQPDGPKERQEGAPVSTAVRRWFPVDLEGARPLAPSEAGLPANGLDCLRHELGDEVDVLSPVAARDVGLRRKESGFSDNTYRVFVSNRFRGEKRAAEIAWAPSLALRAVAFQVEEVAGSTILAGKPCEDQPGARPRIVLEARGGPVDLSRPRWLVLFVFPLDEKTNNALRERFVADVK